MARPTLGPESESSLRRVLAAAKALVANNFDATDPASVPVLVIVLREA